MVDRVQVGVDGSGPSDTALLWAARYAADFNLPLVIEHVIDDSLSLPESAARQQQLANGETLLARARERIETDYCGLQVSAHVLVGDVTLSLADECTDHDLLVIGTHKTGFLRGRAFGARGFAVVAATVGWVAVIPEDHRSSRTGVVVGVPPTHWSAAVESGALLAAREHQSVTLIASAAPEDEASRAPELTSALRLAEEHAPRGSVRAQTSRRHLADAVLDASRGALLLVIEEREAAEGTGYVGALTHDVLLNINSPVLVVRTPSGPSPLSPRDGVA